MPAEKIPLLSEQADRLAFGAWTEEHGLGEYVRTFGGGFRLIGPLDVEALRSSLTTLVARHEALRVSFPDRGRSGCQIVQQPSGVDLAERDLRDVPEDRRLTEAVQAAGAYLSRNPELDEGQRLRTMLVRLGADDHILALAVDHLVADGGSFEILVDELWTLYSAAVRDERPKLPEQRFTYTDFARWEADWLRNDPEPRQAIARTAELLDGMGLSPLITIDGMKRDTNQDYTVGAVGGRFVDERFERLTDRCREARITPFVALLSAYLCALHSCGGPTDLGLMIPISRRNGEHMTDLVSMLSTHTTIRLRLDPTLSFRELTRQVRSVVLESYRLGQVPAPEVAAALAPHMLGRLFLRPSVFFDVAPSGWSGEHRRIGELAVTPVDVPITVRHIENLTLFASISAQELAFTLLYPTDVFEKRAVDDLVRAFTTVVDRYAQEPSTPVRALIA
ncbi:MAG TPA: condensation domain-containing protein [Micromonosporaceae bacterium]